MATLPDASIDCVLTDPPYGTTACKWDSVIPFEPMWKELKRIAKPKAAICLFGSQPFTSRLIASNIEQFKYEWIWEKGKGSNFVHAKNMPIKLHENVIVFSYAPIGHEVQLGESRMSYYPQELLRVDAVWKRPRKYETEHQMTRESHQLERIIEFANYPQSIIAFDNSDNRERGDHPTQKPVELLRYLIRTYTLEGETVLDFTMGSGSTGVACELENRNFIGIEKDAGYFEIAKNRIDGVRTKEPLFAEAA